MAGRRTGRRAAARRALAVLALVCGLGLLVLPAGAAPTASTAVDITVDESVATGDGPNAAGPASLAADEPVGTVDAVAVSPPAGVPGDEGVTVSDEVSVASPVTIVVDESVAPSDAPNVVPPAIVAAAETVDVSDDVALATENPPRPNAGGPYSADEGSMLTLHGSATDTPGEALTYSWDLGGGLTASGASPTILVPDGPDTRTVTLTVCDDRGACASDATTLTIANVAPTATIVSPADGSVFAIDSHVALDGSFTDPAAADTHTAVWTVGGTSIGGTVSEHDGSGTVAAVWVPSSAGFYPLSLTVTDDDGGTTTVEGGTLVVFDPAASVEGTGTLRDPSGDLVTFDVGVHYRLGDTVPSGNVKLTVPHLRLAADSLDWLVVTPPSFALQGVGGGYRFRLDGVTGHPDRLRVRIWTLGGSLVYDSTLVPLRTGNLRVRTS